MRRTLLLAVAALALIAAGCGAGGAGGGAGGGGRITVVATTTQLADLTRDVAGSRARVVGLLAPNVDPHDYEPTPADVAAIAGAAVVVRNGVGLDGWLEPVLSNAGGSPRIIDASRSVHLLPGDARSPAGDPHIWMDPRNAEAIVRAIRDGLAAADPGGASVYRRNATAELARLRALDAQLAAMIARVPVARRKLVTDHDAFGYLARRYHITIVGAAIPSLSTAAEPSARDLVSLAATVRREHVAVIFAEQSVDSRLEAALAREAGVKVGPALYADSLGPPGSPGATYEGMMRTDMRRLVAGFLTR